MLRYLKIVGLVLAIVPLNVLCMEDKSSCEESSVETNKRKSRYPAFIFTDSASSDEDGRNNKISRLNIAQVMIDSTRSTHTENSPRTQKRLSSKIPKKRSKSIDECFNKAIESENDTLVDQFIRVDINCATGRLQTTALILMVRKHNYDAIMRLLEYKNLSVNQKDSRGDTALHHAVMERDLESINILLRDPRLNPMLTNDDGYSAQGLAHLIGFANTEASGLLFAYTMVCLTVGKMAFCLKVCERSDDLALAYAVEGVKQRIIADYARQEVGADVSLKFDDRFVPLCAKIPDYIDDKFIKKMLKIRLGQLDFEIDLLNKIMKEEAFMLALSCDSVEVGVETVRLRYTNEYNKAKRSEPSIIFYCTESDMLKNMLDQMICEIKRGKL